MDISNYIHLNILDLPNEILVIIFNKLYMIDVLYSLVGINERFNRLVLDPLYIHHLDMIINSSLDHVSSIDNQVLSRICEKVLPQIHHRVNKLSVEPCSMKHILHTINYPQLYSLSLICFPERILFQHLKGILFYFHFNEQNNEFVRHKLIIIFFVKLQVIQFFVIFLLNKSHILILISRTRDRKISLKLDQIFSHLFYLCVKD